MDDVETGTKRLEHGVARDRPVVELPGVVKKRQKHVKDNLRVRLATDVPAQQLRDRGQEPLANRIELGECARLGEKPLSITERVRVFRTEGSDRRRADMAHEHIRAYIRRQLVELDLFAVVDGATPHQDFAALVKAEPPAERRATRGRRERFRLEGQDSTCEIGAISDEPEQSSHAVSSPSETTDEPATRLTH